MEPEQQADDDPQGEDSPPVSGRRVLLVGLGVLGAIVLLWTGLGQIRKPPPRPPPSVVAEATLMVAVQQALEKGDAATALRALDTHAERYPNGTLAEAREAQRVRALCALGRVADAEVARARFVERYPSSEHAEAARQPCAAGP